MIYHHLFFKKIVFYIYFYSYTFTFSFNLYVIKKKIQYTKYKKIKRFRKIITSEVQRQVLSLIFCKLGQLSARMYKISSFNNEHSLKSTSSRCGLFSICLYIFLFKLATQIVRHNFLQY